MVLVAVAALALIALSFAIAATSPLGSRVAHLHGSRGFPDAEAKVTFVPPQKSVLHSLLVAVRPRHFPDPFDRYFVVWLVRPSGKAYYATSIETATGSFWPGALEVAGDRHTEGINARRANRIAITIVSSDDRKALLNRARLHDYARPIDLQGEPLAHGRIRPDR